MTTAPFGFLAPCGVVYSVTGARFLREAENSARSVREHMPDLKIAVYTDRTDAEPGLFDFVRPILEPTYSDFDKQFGFRESLFERTLFLDSDTRVCAPFGELFELLKRFDFAATREFFSGKKCFGPECYDDFNAGVIGFSATDPARATLDRWYELALKERAQAGAAFNDQGCLRKATYEIEALRVYVLPNHYNLRLTAPQILNVWARPVILHGRVRRFGRIVAELGATHDHRLLIPNLSNFCRLGFAVSGDGASASALRSWLSLSAAFARFLRGAVSLLNPSRCKK